MSASPPPFAAPWLVRALHELQRRQHLLIHGNIDDLTRWNHQYSPLSAVLTDFLRMAGFAVIGRYGLADGLTYADTAAREGAARGPSGLPAPSFAASSASPASGAGMAGGWEPFGAAGNGGTSTRAERLERSGDDLRTEVNARRPARPRTTADALGTIRGLLQQSREPTAVVVDAADLVVGQGGETADRATNYAHLRRLLEEAAEVGTSGAGFSLRNTLVMLTPDLGVMPEWLRASPLVATVQADRPGVPERADLLTRHIGNFHGADQLTTQQRTNAVSAMVTLTDGMTVRDMQTIQETSRITGISPSAPRKLVARHRFGEPDDPWEHLDLDKVRRAEELLGKRVTGQPAAVDAVCNVLVNARVGIDFVAGDADNGGRPRGVFFFVGPTGVGKTELAKAVAELVFEDESAMRRFDMSEYNQEHASERLTGSPPGYVGHEQGGALTNWVLEHPFSVLLFDEIEKAHSSIFDKFLQIIDDGRLTDGQGRTAYFSHSIVIFTSNRGAATMPKVDPEAPQPYRTFKEHFTAEVEAFFRDDLKRPELLGRLGGGIVVFDILRDKGIREITAKFLGQIKDSAKARGYVLVIEEDAVQNAVVEHVLREGAALGARPIRDPLLDQWLRVPLNRWILENSPPTGTRIHVHPGRPGEPFTVGGTQPFSTMRQE